MIKNFIEIGMFCFSLWLLAAFYLSIVYTYPSPSQDLIYKILFILVSYKDPIYKILYNNALFAMPQFSILKLKPIIGVDL